MVKSNPEYIIFMSAIKITSFGRILYVFLNERKYCFPENMYPIRKVPLTALTTSDFGLRFEVVIFKLSTTGNKGVKIVRKLLTSQMREAVSTVRFLYFFP